MGVDVKSGSAFWLGMQLRSAWLQPTYYVPMYTTGHCKPVRAGRVAKVVVGCVEEEGEELGEGRSAFPCGYRPSREEEKIEKQKEKKNLVPVGSVSIVHNLAFHLGRQSPLPAYSLVRWRLRWGCFPPFSDFLLGLFDRADKCRHRPTQFG